MQIFEIWESHETMVLIEDGHEEKDALVKGCKRKARFKARDWDEANTLIRRYQKFGLRTLESRLEP